MATKNDGGIIAEPEALGQSRFSPRKVPISLRIIGTTGELLYWGKEMLGLEKR